MKQVANTLKKQLKQELPEYKFSIKSDYNSITIALMEGPGDFEGHHQLNHFRFGPNASNYGNNHPEELKRIFNKVDELLEKLQPNVIDTVDADYGNVPNYYKYYNIGKWDKPYIKTNKVDKAA